MIQFIAVDGLVVCSISTIVKQLESTRSNSCTKRHSRGLVVVAEGMENNKQKSLLTGLGCDQMQGYLVSKPIPQDAVLELLMKYNSEDLPANRARIPV